MNKWVARLALTAATLIALGLVAWWLLLPNAPTDAPRPSSQPPFFSQARPEHEIHTSPPLERLSMPPKPKSSSEDAEKSKDTEVCGYGVAKDEKEMNTLTARAQVDANRVLAEAIDALLVSPSEQDLALGLWLRVRLAATQATAHIYPDCGLAEACMTAFDTLERRAIASTVGPLATLAARSRDPVVYALALQACNRRNESFCDEIDARGWIERDPNNAAAHLAAIRTTSKGNLQESRQLFASAGKQLTFDARMPDLSPLYAQPAMQNLSPLVDMMVTNTGLSSIWDGDWKVLDPVRQHCGSRSPDYPGKQADCGTMAQVLRDQGKTLFSVSISTMSATAAGWDPAEIQAQRKALNDLMAESVRHYDADNPLSCTSLKKSNALARDISTKGELAALRARLAASKDASNGVRSIDKSDPTKK